MKLDKTVRSIKFERVSCFMKAGVCLERDPNCNMKPILHMDFLSMVVVATQFFFLLKCVSMVHKSTGKMLDFGSVQQKF